MAWNATSWIKQPTIVKSTGKSTAKCTRVLRVRGKYLRPPRSIRVGRRSFVPYYSALALPLHQQPVVASLCLRCLTTPGYYIVIQDLRSFPISLSSRITSHTSSINKGKSALQCGIRLPDVCQSIFTVLQTPLPWDAIGIHLQSWLVSLFLHSFFIQSGGVCVLGVCMCR